MKKLFITSLVLPFFLVANTVYAKDENPIKSPRKAALKRNAVALCAALLTTTTASAVVITKMSGTNPTGGMSTRLRTYRNRNALAVFLGKGLGQKYNDDDFEISDTQVEVAEYNPPSRFTDSSIESLLLSMTMDILERSIFVSKQNSDGSMSGYIVLPGLVANYQLSAYDAGGARDFEFRAVGTNDIISKGTLRAPRESSIL